MSFITVATAVAGGAAKIISASRGAKARSRAKGASKTYRPRDPRVPR